MSPDITVIVPYHNERATIEFTLARVGEQTLPAKAAIFVNSTSTDDTFNVVDCWIRKNQQRFSTRFFNVFDNTDNPASSKNAGVRRAGTQWLAFMDCGQNFEKTWLEQQFRFALDNGFDVVSGAVYAVGENWVDRCAVAQTYGYKRLRPCLPTTLLKKSVFERTGPLEEGRRAGYDAAWLIKLGKLGIRRGINKGVRINYIGFNFAPNLARLYQKSVLYAKPSVAIEGYLSPYLYVVGPFLFLITLAVSVQAAAALVLLYLLARIFFIPVLKSRSAVFFNDHPLEALFGLGIAGFVIDLGKLVGTWQGMHFYFLRGRAAGQ